MATHTFTQPEVAETPSVLTGEELFSLADIGRAELVKGELIRMSPTGHIHGRIESKFDRILAAFVEQHNLGQVLVGEVGIYTQRDPDTVRAADVAYLSNEQLAQVRSKSYLDVAPDLIVEILSPSDRWVDIEEKLDEYFAIGVRMVWLANPKRCEVFVYQSPTDVTRFSDDATLAGGDVLPGFEAAVAEFFR